MHAVGHKVGRLEHRVHCAGTVQWRTVLLNEEERLRAPGDDGEGLRLSAAVLDVQVHVEQFEETHNFGPAVWYF